MYWYNNYINLQTKHKGSANFPETPVVNVPEDWLDV